MPVYSQGSVSVVALFVCRPLVGCTLLSVALFPQSQSDAVVVAVPPALFWGHPRLWAPSHVQAFVWRSTLLYIHVQVQWFVHHTDRSQKLDSSHFLHLYVVSLSFLLLVVQGPWPVC